MTYKYADKLVEKFRDSVLKNLAIPGITTEDGAYYLTCVMQDTMRMLYSICKQNLSPEQAKISMQIALEAVLLDIGMSVRVHELESKSVQ